jgi:hypothetical protein
VAPHYLRFALAVISAAGCGASQTEVQTPPAPAPSSSATTNGPAEPTVEAQDQGDPTVGSGACRCSWDPKPQGVVRVCRVGEHSHTGALCVRGTRPKYGGGLMLGPLPPPDLVA